VGELLQQVHAEAGAALEQGGVRVLWNPEKEKQVEQAVKVLFENFPFSENWSGASNQYLLYIFT
jgi:hypothetical protein